MKLYGWLMNTSSASCATPLQLKKIHLKFEGEFLLKAKFMKEYKIKIEVALFKENDMYVAYCPALQLSSYGENEKDAKYAFDEALSIFLEETTEKGTLEKELLQLGWSLRKMPKPDYQPPHLDVVSLSKKKPSFYKERFAVPI